MRLVVIAALLACCACGPPLEVNLSREMTPDQMANRATHIFIGEILDQRFESWPFLRIPGEPFTIQGRGKWMVLVRHVKVNAVIRGTESRAVIPIHEIFWTGGGSGHSNSTEDAKRYLFLLRREGYRYHIVRDYFRSVYRVYGDRRELPLDDKHPFLERVALMNYWVGSGDSLKSPTIYGTDRMARLSEWREAKLLRGLVRHPSREVRWKACRDLVAAKQGLDECWDAMAPRERAAIVASGTGPRWWEGVEKANNDARKRSWKRFFLRLRHYSTNDLEMLRDQLRLLTTVNDSRMRAEHCSGYMMVYPGDTDNGCPPDCPLPATIVTKDGDVPLTGAWPADH